MTEILYRIIDANYNRAREAFRVMEEYCRFGLNDQSLSATAKTCRHQLCKSLSAIDPVQLLSSRDTENDVGKELRIDGQLQRKSLEDCFTAAAKRASEALRALAESTQAIDPDIAAVMEKLRFEVYALEKDAVLSSSAKQKFKSVRLCVLLNTLPQTPFSDVLELAQQCVDGGADCLQLRAKGLTDSHLLTLAQKFTALCSSSGIVSIINDRVDIALLSGADGVHLGQDEISVAYARQLARKPLIVGISTHNPQELQNAINSKCDYVGLGPAFASPTKPALKIAGIEYIRQSISMLEKSGIFHLAIGGITAANIDQLLQTGAKAVAVSAEISAAENPADSCKTLKGILLKGIK